MKNKYRQYNIFLVFLGLFFVTAISNEALAQNAKKNSVRIKVDYIKIMNGEAYLNIKASSRIKKQNVAVSNIEFSVSNEFDDEEFELGSGTTDGEGESKFMLPSLDKITPDSTNTYTIAIAFDGNDSYKRASRSVSFKNADIVAKLVVKDSINYISGTLKDVAKDSLIEGEYLEVQVQRLFSPLKIGEEFNQTDEDGTILVPVEEGIPGVNGNLIMEVVLNDSDEYGTVKALVKAPIGIPIVEESTFDQRTLWSPRTKTPIFILIIANFLIIGIWGFLVYLISNFFKIAKS
jgi:hypothetical protein